MPFNFGSAENIWRDWPRVVQDGQIQLDMQAGALEKIADFLERSPIKSSSGESLRRKASKYRNFAGIMDGFMGTVAQNHPYEVGRHEDPRPDEGAWDQRRNR